MSTLEKKSEVDQVSLYLKKLEKRENLTQSKQKKEMIKMKVKINDIGKTKQK